MTKPSAPIRDELFAEPLTQTGLFTFNESVAGVFPDMINRSVPGYATVIAMTGVLAAQHARPDSAFMTSDAHGAPLCYPWHAKSTIPLAN